MTKLTKIYQMKVSHYIILQVWAYIYGYSDQLVIVQDDSVLFQLLGYVFHVHKSLWSLMVGELFSFVSSSWLSQIVLWLVEHYAPCTHEEGAYSISTIDIAT